MEMVAQKAGSQKAGWLSSTWGVIGGVTGVIALILAWLTYQKDNGYSEADIHLVGALPSPAETSRFMQPGMAGIPTIQLSSLDDMIRWNPAVAVEFQNARPMEALRTEVTAFSDPSGFPSNIIDSTSNPNAGKGKMTPWVLEGFKTQDHPVMTSVHKGLRVAVPVADVLVGYMREIQVKKDDARRGLPHYTKLQIRVFGKEHGSTKWTEQKNCKAIYVSFSWIPSGFDEEACKEFEAKFRQPLQEIREELTALPQITVDP